MISLGWSYLQKSMFKYETSTFVERSEQGIRKKYPVNAKTPKISATEFMSNFLSLVRQTFTLMQSMLILEKMCNQHKKIASYADPRISETVMISAKFQPSCQLFLTNETRMNILKNLSPEILNENWASHTG